MKAKRRDLALIVQWGNMSAMVRSAMRRRKFASLLNSWQPPAVYFIFLILVTYLVTTTSSLGSQMYLFNNAITSKFVDQDYYSGVDNNSRITWPNIWHVGQIWAWLQVY